MKVDRFVKVLLVIIALLLAINCVTNTRMPFIGSSTEAAPSPSFFQVGKVYEMDYITGPYKVLKMDNNGWMYVEGTETFNREMKWWVNTNQMKYVRER